MALLPPRSLFSASRFPFASYPTPLLVSFHSPPTSLRNSPNVVPKDTPCSPTQCPQAGDLIPSQSQQQPIRVECPPGLAFVPYVIPCEQKAPEVTTPDPPTTPPPPAIEYIHYPVIYKVKNPVTTTTEAPPTTPKPCKIFHHVYLYHILKPSPEPSTTTPAPVTEKPCSTSNQKVIKYIYYPQIPSPEPETTPMSQEENPLPPSNYHGSRTHSYHDNQGMIEEFLAKISSSDHK